MAAALLALALASLASAQTVYIYAQCDTPARSWLPVFVDAKPSAELRRGAYFAVHLPPGPHSFTLPNGVPLSINLNEPIHLRLDWNHHLNRPPIPVLTRVPRARAEEEMKFLTYIPQKKIHATTVPPADPRPPANPQFQPRPPQ